MVPAYARILNAVYTSQLKVSYFLGASWTEQVSQWRAGEIMKRIMCYKLYLFLGRRRRHLLYLWSEHVLLSGQNASGNSICLFEPSNWEGIKEKVLLR